MCAVPVFPQGDSWQGGGTGLFSDLGGNLPSGEEKNSTYTCTPTPSERDDGPDGV